MLLLLQSFGSLPPPGRKTQALKGMVVVLACLSGLVGALPALVCCDARYDTCPSPSRSVQDEKVGA